MDANFSKENKIIINYNKDGKESILNIIKSKYILKKILYYLPYNKFLNIMKYNKKLQNKLDIGESNYSEYSQIKIEIEVFPNEKNRDFISNRWFYERYKDYIHVYLDDNKEEIKRNYYTKEDKFNKIKIIIYYKTESLNGLFCFCKCIKSIKFINFERKNIDDMSDMFYWCRSLESIDLSNFNTDKVKDMSYMFYGCRSLRGINLSKFNTNNVINMEKMFMDCCSLKELNLSNFNTNNVLNMSFMFSGCSSLKDLDLSSFKTNYVQSMESMFAGCSSLISLNLSNFSSRPNILNSAMAMFRGCYSLRELNLSNFKPSYGTLMHQMFYCCYSLTSLNFTFDFVRRMNSTFAFCPEELIMKIKNEHKDISDKSFKNHK